MRGIGKLTSDTRYIKTSNRSSKDCPQDRLLLAKRRPAEDCRYRVEENRDLEQEIASLLEASRQGSYGSKLCKAI